MTTIVVGANIRAHNTNVKTIDYFEWKHIMGDYIILSKFNY